LNLDAADQLSHAADGRAITLRTADRRTERQQNARDDVGAQQGAEHGGR
jgi:hypothetical protein